jgi:hypothetical protein
MPSSINLLSVVNPAHEIVLLAKKQEAMMS